MSKAKRCDRCGKYYDLIPENLPGTKTGPQYYIQHFKKEGNLGASVESFDLCPECAQQLTDWAENPDIEEIFDKHGYWIDNNNKTWSCSICQSWIPDEQHSYARHCLHCGARMDEEKIFEKQESTKEAETKTKG